MSNVLMDSGSVKLKQINYVLKDQHEQQSKTVIKTKSTTHYCIIREFPLNLEIFFTIIYILSKPGEDRCGKPLNDSGE